MIKDALEVAIKALSLIETKKLSERLALATTVDTLNITNIDVVKIAYTYVFETIRRLNLVDNILSRYLKPKSIQDFDVDIQSFLRLYVYRGLVIQGSLKFIIREAENISKHARSILGWVSLRDIEHVLGVLFTARHFISLKNLSDVEKIGFKTFHPVWFVNYCLKLFGRQKALAFLESNMKPLPLYVRFNTLKAKEEIILNKLKKEGVILNDVAELDYLYEVIHTKNPLIQTLSYKEGFFFIQDKTSCLTVETLKPKCGMNVLDVCAAPGAKTTYLAQLMYNTGCIYSIDYSKRRMIIWKNEIKRMNVKNAIPIIADACETLPLKTVVDALLLDPPCTSTGVFGKFPSAKWRINRKSFDEMAEIQIRMLNNSVDKIKPKGTLIYSTCSITVEENEMVIESFLKNNQDFSLDDIVPEIGLPGLRGLKKCRRFFSSIHKCNNFFIAKLIKKG